MSPIEKMAFEKTIHQRLESYKDGLADPKPDPTRRLSIAVKKTAPGVNVRTPQKDGSNSLNSSLSNSGDGRFINHTVMRPLTLKNDSQLSSVTSI